MPRRRRPGRPPLAKPTTVRLEEHLDRWVRTQGREHTDGQSGVINDAVRHYMKLAQSNASILFETIAGSNGQDASDAR